MSQKNLGPKNSCVLRSLGPKKIWVPKNLCQKKLGPENILVYGKMKKLQCFKAYDIRGKIPEDLNTELAYLIGLAYAEIINPGKVIIGYDVRLESIDLANALIKGLTDSGVDIVNIGLCGTEEVYFHTF